MDKLNERKGTQLAFAPLPAFMEAIMVEGGLAEYIARHGDPTIRA